MTGFVSPSATSVFVSTIVRQRTNGESSYAENISLPSTVWKRSVEDPSFFGVGLLSLPLSSRSIFLLFFVAASVLPVLFVFCFFLTIYSGNAGGGGAGEDLRAITGRQPRVPCLARTASAKAFRRAHSTRLIDYLFLCHRFGPLDE